MKWRLAQVLNIPLIRNLSYLVPSQSHVAHSKHKARCPNRSCFVFPPRNPTYPFQSSSRATRHPWARKMLRKPTISEMGLLSNVQTCWCSTYLILRIARRGVYLSHSIAKVPSTFLKTPQGFLPFLPSFGNEGSGRGLAGRAGGCSHACVPVFWKQIFNVPGIWAGISLDSVGKTHIFSSKWILTLVEKNYSVYGHTLNLKTSFFKKKKVLRDAR